MITHMIFSDVLLRHSVQYSTSVQYIISTVHHNIISIMIPSEKCRQNKIDHVGGAKHVVRSAGKFEASYGSALICNNNNY